MKKKKRFSFKKKNNKKRERGSEVSLLGLMSAPFYMCAYVFGSQTAEYKLRE